MSDTSYIDYVTPAVNAEWLNEINDHVWHDTPVTGTTVHDASVIKNTPAGTIAATTVQMALNELDTEKATVSSVNEKVSSTTLAASSGSSLVGFIQAGIGAVTRTEEAKSREIVSIKDFGAACDGVTDDTAAVQAAINYCATFSQWPALLVPGKTRITASVNIDRMVDTTTSEFRIIGFGPAAGFYVDSAITIFNSTIAVTADPKSEHIAFEGIHFEASSAALSAYVISKKFLRVRFDRCFFRRIRCLSATIYAQDYRFTNCKAAYWSGQFFASDGAFGIQSVASVFEFGGGGFYLVSPAGVSGTVGCAFSHNIFEGSAGPFLSATSILGMQLHGNYFEGNTNPAISFEYNALPHRGISHCGNFYASTAANLADASFYEIGWGRVEGAASSGNYANGRLHNTSNAVGRSLHIFGDNAAIELTKGGKTGLLDPARATAVGRLSGYDAGILYASNGQYWVGFDSSYFALVFGPGEVQNGANTPVRILYGTVSPGVNNGNYGNPYWTKGSKVLNSVPAVGQPKGWICTVSGNPGTWVSEGNL